ncbi:MAG TPA: 5-oxoprolinase subunit PxpA [Thermomicrobiales bacterium]|nr:5-oxoprolinase subunit PxpA [Thermomicrobiales bacterium]
MPGTIRIDINSDVGESYGAFRQGADDELFPLISSANVACGFHGGDPRTMERTVRALANLGVAIGAHPSYPDLVGFGRRVIQATPDEIRTDVIYQIGALKGFCDIAGVPLHHVKPHGALYNLAARDAAVAGAIVAAVHALAPDVAIYAQPGSVLESSAREAGLQVMREAFADRAYLANGSLASRHLPGAVLTDPREVGERVIRMIRGEAIPTVDGDPIAIEAETICIHSDTPTAVPIARELRRMLGEAGIAVETIV